ncbi:hypothetical protein SEA_KEELAN_7 [Gordonia phage Keelan]|nr:hypothetical protein SEA_KEELAN_7 [Gordonia phage Keelan]
MIYEIRKALQDMNVFRGVASLYASCNICGEAETLFSSIEYRKWKAKHVACLGNPKVPCGKTVCCLGQGHIGECRQ